MLNIYVSPYGNDDFEGTSMAVAFRTITKAFSVAEPGSKIYLAEGVYPELVEILTSGNPVITQGVEGVIQGDLITVQPLLNLAVVQIGDDPEQPILIGAGKTGILFRDVKIIGNTALTDCSKFLFQNVDANGYLTFDLTACASVYFNNSKMDSVVSGGELALDSRGGSDIRVTNSVVTGSIHGEGITSLSGTKMVGNYASDLSDLLIEKAEFTLGAVAFPNSKNTVLHKTLVVANYLWDIPQDIVDIDKSTLIVQGFVDTNTLEEPFVDLLSSPGLRNSIVFPLVDYIQYPEILNFGFSYSLIKNLPEDPIAANTYADSCMEGINPRFTNPSENDFSLQDDSPCIDAADPMKAVSEGGGVRADIGYHEYQKSVNLEGGVVIKDGFGSFYNVIYNIKESDPVIYQVLNHTLTQVHANTMHNRNSLKSLKEGIVQFEDDTVAHLGSLDSFVTNQHSANAQLNVGIASVYSLVLLTRRDYFNIKAEDTVTIATTELHFKGLGLTVSQTAEEVQLASSKPISFLNNISVPDPKTDTPANAMNLDFAMNGFDTLTEQPRTIFVDPVEGNDNWDGVTADKAVASLDRAFSRCTRSRKNIIKILGTGITLTQDTTVSGVHCVIDGNGNFINWNGNLVEDSILEFRDVRYQSSNMLQFKRSKIVIDEVPSSIGYSGPGHAWELIDSTLIFGGDVSGSFGIERFITGNGPFTEALISLVASTVYLRQVRMADANKAIVAKAGSRGLVQYTGPGFGDNINTLLTQDSSCNIVLDY